MAAVNEVFKKTEFLVEKCFVLVNLFTDDTFYHKNKCHVNTSIKPFSSTIFQRLRNKSFVNFFSSYFMLMFMQNSKTTIIKTLLYTFLFSLFYCGLANKKATSGKHTKSCYLALEPWCILEYELPSPPPPPPTPPPHTHTHKNTTPSC